MKTPILTRYAAHLAGCGSAIVILLSVGNPAARAGQTVLLQTNQGVSFVQVDFAYGTNFHTGQPGPVVTNSNTGQVIVTNITVVTNTGIGSGFINVATTEGWVVHNLPVSAGFAYPKISAALKLPTPSGQRLENAYGIVVPDDNVPGIGIAGNNPPVIPPNSLVGQLDITMQRQGVVSRLQGGQTMNINAAKGKLDYMANNGLSDFVLKHQALGLEMQADIWGTTPTPLVSTYVSAPTFDFILSQVMLGADVEQAGHRSRQTAPT